MTTGSLGGVGAGNLRVVGSLVHPQFRLGYGTSPGNVILLMVRINPEIEAAD